MISLNCGEGPFSNWESNERSGQLGRYVMIQISVSDDLFQVKQINPYKVLVALIKVI
jgi:hypothetical protein